MHPNIIVYLISGFRSSDLPLAREIRDGTGALDRLVQQGTVFHACYAVSCENDSACMMQGRYPTAIDDKSPPATFPDLLRQAGYRTAVWANDRDAHGSESLLVAATSFIADTPARDPFCLVLSMHCGLSEGLSSVAQLVDRVERAVAARDGRPTVVALLLNPAGPMPPGNCSNEKAFPRPLVIWDPRIIAGRRVLETHELVLDIDLAPALLEIAGVEAPASMHGRSLVPLLANPNADGRRVAYPGGGLLRTPRWSYVYPANGCRVDSELYDLRHDPAAQHNLAMSMAHGERIELLEARLLALRQAIAGDHAPHLRGVCDSAARHTPGRLPDFIGIGAQKAGTTWLYEQLRAHPQLYLPAIKELNFFGSDKPVHWYSAFFDDAQPMERCGEISPNYLPIPDLHGRIRDIAPGARLICLLRDPVHRAYSQWKMARERGNLPRELSFVDAFRQDRRAIRTQGDYVQPLKRIATYFPLGSQLLVIRHDDIKNEPRSVLSEIYRYLEVDDSFMPASINEQIGAARDGNVIPEADAAEARAHYLPGIRVLEDFLEWDLAPWTEG